MAQAHLHNERVRPPAVAGLFYPAAPDELRAGISGLLARAPAAPRRNPKALIAPHAGYAYSGEVAAAAFAALRGSEHAVKRVVVIGPAHHVAFDGIAGPTVDAFATPLGRVAVDHTALAAIDDLPYVKSNDAAHAPDHALEVELPFLQVLLRSFAVIPLLVGRTGPRQVAEVLARLWSGPDMLVVVSSDLSHFHTYETAQRLDQRTADAIETGDWAKLGPGDACGFLPIAGLLIESERRGLTARRLSLCSSGDTAGERDRVVGYGAWIFAQAPERSRAMG